MTTEDTLPSEREVPPLEHRAFFDIDTDAGYVRIEQSVGNQPLYTPSEAREIAEEILAAADAATAESDG